MSEKHPDPEDDPLEKAVKLRERRQADWQATGEREPWRNLSMIGGLAWIVVIPMLVGVALGRWLDRIFHAGIFWSGALIFLGAILGGWMAWKRANRQ